MTARRTVEMPSDEVDRLWAEGLEKARARHVPIQPNTPEWLEARRKGIGASEIAAVLGISPWESPFSLWWRKRQGWETDGNDEMRWGTVLEPVIAAEYERRHVAEVLFPAPLVMGPEPWMLATPDRFIAPRQQCGPCDYGLPMSCGCVGPEDANAVLELKTAHSAHDGWGEPGTDDIPVHYRAQVQWQMLCTGHRLAAVAVLIAGSDYREYRVRRDDKDIAVMVEAGRRFMARLESGDPPPLDDHRATLHTLKQIYDTVRDETITITDDVADGYLRAVEFERKAKALKRKYEVLVRDQAGGGRRIESWSGRKVATHVITDVTMPAQPERVDHRDYLLPPRASKS